jgi:hypothetical protein
MRERPYQVRQIAPLVAAYFLCLTGDHFIDGFTVTHSGPTVSLEGFGLRMLKLSSRSSATATATTRLYMVKRGSSPRRSVQVPLLDLLAEASSSDKTITPLPSSYLPNELTTPFVYGMQFNRPIHKLILNEATQAMVLGASNDANRLYGHLAWKKEKDSLIGAIGCTAEVLINAPTTEMVVLGEDDNPEGMFRGTKQLLSNDATEDTSSITVLCRGSFRFVVTEIIKTIPYPVVLVDELVDTDHEEVQQNSPSAKADDEDEDDDDDDEDDYDYDYAHLSVPELMQRTMRGIQSFVSQKLQEIETKPAPTPLEKSILEDSGVAANLGPSAAEQDQVEEMAAVWDIFQTSLIDDIDPKDRRYAVAFMAAELANMSNDIRQQILVEQNSSQRLRIVLQELEEIVGMARARKLAASITDVTDESSKELKVGKPALPPWSRSIRKGTRIEYFWNEQAGWLGGRVAEDPVMILDELIVTVEFDDGEVHKLPFQADEKVRWRPGK